MGFVGVDALKFDVEAGGGEEGVALFLRFSIAASMLSRSAMSKQELTGLGVEEGFYIRRLDFVDRARCRRDHESVFRKWEAIG